MTHGQICFQHEYCTNCPIRRECTVRPIFYSDEEYEEWRSQTLKISERIAKTMGYPHWMTSSSIGIGIQMMDKRRAQELKEHPSYSPI